MAVHCASYIVREEVERHPISEYPVVAAVIADFNMHNVEEEATLAGTIGSALLLT